MAENTQLVYQPTLVIREDALSDGIVPSGLPIGAGD
jgi:hypothetical protein